MGEDNIDGIVIGVYTTQWRNSGSIPDRNKRLSLLHSIYTGSEAHPASY